MYKLNCSFVRSISIKNLFCAVYIKLYVYTFENTDIHILFSFFFLHFSFLFGFNLNQTTPTTTTTNPTDIMKKTVKLMISISNKSNLITTNTSLISNEIMRCLHQLQMLIS